MTPLAETTVERIRFRRPGPRAFLRVGAAAVDARVLLNGAEVGRHSGPWTPFQLELTAHLRDDNELEIVCTDREHATQGFLPTLGLRWTGARNVEILTEPPPHRPAARQRSSVRGTRLLVDGKPFRVRGILHWGAYPELGHPWPSEARMRHEIDDILSLGFNLVKLCLWVPPPRYYELCEEMGLLVWQEYPVWNTPLLGEEIEREMEELLRNDAPWSCVILRSLTCENDHVDAEAARRLVGRAHEIIPGSLVLDNSAWISNERFGDFHDEHPYLHNAQWRFYGERMRGAGLEKPLLLGESMCVDDGGTPEGRRRATAVRRFQIETLAHELPDAGYVVTALRDIEKATLGVIYDGKGRKKARPEDWSWQRDFLEEPRVVPLPTGPFLGPRKGEWKCPEHTYWSPVLEILCELEPGARRLLEDELVFDLLTGRVLEKTDGTRVLVQLVCGHDCARGAERRLPLVIEFTTSGKRRLVSALRTDTLVGQRLHAAFRERTEPAPEIGPLVGTSIVLEQWEMEREDGSRVRVVCDTPLVNRGRNVFEGWATFRTEVDLQGGDPWTLHCEAVGDYYEVRIDGKTRGEAGNRTGTWDGTRDVPREFPLELAPGRHRFELRVRDWRAAGGVVGPVYLLQDPTERIF
jgi:hypothetical protein